MRRIHGNIERTIRVYTYETVWTVHKLHVTSCRSNVDDFQVVSVYSTHVDLGQFQGCRGDGISIPILTRAHTHTRGDPRGDPHTHDRVYGCRGDGMSIPIPTPYPYLWGSPYPALTAVPKIKHMYAEIRNNRNSHFTSNKARPNRLTRKFFHSQVLFKYERRNITKIVLKSYIELNII